MLSEDMAFTMLFKRVFLLLCLALVVFGAGSFAYADEPLKAVCAFTPADFLEPGTSRLSVTILNTSDKAIENTRIAHDANKEGEVIGSVEPGETVHFSIDVDVTKKMLDAGKVNLTISFRHAGKNQKTQISAKVTRVNALAEATLTSRISKTALYEGETSEAEYRLINTGTVEIQNAVIIDAAFAFASEAFTLLPGEEKVFKAVSQFSESAISSPRADFVSGESQNPYVVHAPSTALHVTNDNLSITLDPSSISVSYGGRAHFSVTVKNNSLFTYSALALSSDHLGVISDVKGQLKAGESATFHVETPPMTAQCVFPVMLTMREAGGSELSFFAGECTVNVENAPDRNPVIHASANPEGSAPFTITISGANRDLKNVSLSEKKLGKIKTFLVIKADTETVFSPAVPVQKGASHEFFLTWEENGTTFTAAATPVISLTDTEGSDPVSLNGISHASLYAMVNATRLPEILIIIALVLLAALIAFFIIYKSLQAKKRRLAAREAIGKTNKFAPIRIKDTDKENQ